MSKYGVLVVSHGSRSVEWVKLVDRAVAGMRLPAGMPVFSSFLELVEGRLIPDGIRALEAQGVTDLIVVPLFVSAGSTHVDEIAYAFGAVREPPRKTGLPPFRSNARVHFGAPMDDDPVVARIVCDRLRSLSVEPRREALLVIGHGSDEPGYRERWRHTLETAAERARSIGGFAGAEAATLLPDNVGDKLRRLMSRHADGDVLAVPLFLSEGYFTEKVIPERLKGYRCKYDGRAMLPHPLVSEWMERQVRSLLATNLERGTNG